MPDEAGPGQDWNALRRRIIGLGERSIHKSYYPQLQQRLNELRRFKALLDGSSEGIFLVRLPGARLVDVNESACHQLGYSCADLLELHFHDLLDEEGASTMHGLLDSLRGGAVGRSVTAELIRSNGSCFPAEMSMRFVSFDQEHYAVIVARNITERLRMEKELQRIQNLESLGVLAGGIAHDFNNSLAAILNQISLAKMNLGNIESVTEKLDFAENACLQAKGLTRQLLTFAKGGEPVRRMVSMVGLIVDAQRLVLAGTNVKPVLSMPEELWPVHVDPGQISQVLHNILINAVQAMPQGGIVRISARNVSPRDTNPCTANIGDHIQLQIEDNGPGIPEEHLGNIFDPYFTTKATGNGLGLATSHSIIRKHNGTIFVESEKGRGARFSICLPAFSQAEEPTRVSRPAPALKSREATILFMDDDKLIRETMDEILQTLGYATILAGDGREALAALERAKAKGRKVDVAIMDLTVPGGEGGAEVVQSIKAAAGGIKAIVSSGYAMLPAMARYAEHGFDAVLPKPYTVDELHRTILDLLADAGGSAGGSVRTDGGQNTGHP